MTSIKGAGFGLLLGLLFAAPVSGQGSEQATVITTAKIHTATLEPAVPATPAEREVKFAGFASVAYTHNFNDPATGVNPFRAFDFDDRELKLDVIEGSAVLDAAAPGEIGFHVDLLVGQSLPRISAATGLFRDRVTGQAEDVDLKQGYVSYLADVGKGLRLNAGKFVTPIGIELIEGHDGYNDNYSHSYLFTYGPYTHTGVSALYDFTKRVSGAFHVVQGWDNFDDNNDAKTIIACATLRPLDKAEDGTVVVNFIKGPEQANNTVNDRQMLDFVGIWKPTTRLTLSGNADFGRDEGLGLAGGTAHWDGFAGYARYDFSKKFYLAARAERYNDIDGARTGVPQALTEVTVTPTYKFNDDWILRADLRRDSSDQLVFLDGITPTKDQTTFAVNAIVRF